MAILQTKFHEIGKLKCALCLIQHFVEVVLKFYSLFAHFQCAFNYYALQVI